MILDDGGDLTNMVLDKYPELGKRHQWDYLKKLQLVYIDYMIRVKNGTSSHYLL